MAATASKQKRQKRTNTSCVRCLEGSYDDPFFELVAAERDPHHVDHFVCVDCFGELHARRGCQPFFKCPEANCRSRIVAHHCFKKRERYRRAKGGVVQDELHSKGPATYIKEPDKKRDPIRTFLYEEDSFKQNHMQLALAWPENIFSSDVTSKTRSMSILIPFVKSADDCDSKTKRALVHFMTMLYFTYFHPEPVDSVQKLQVTNMTDIEKPILGDDSFVTSSLIAFGTGKLKEETLPHGINSNVFQKNQHHTFWVASEIIRRGRSGKPGFLQDLIQKQLTVFQAPKKIKELLCKFRIAASRERIRLADIDDVNKKLLHGWDLTGKNIGCLLSPMIT